VFYRHYGRHDVVEFVIGHLWFGLAAGVLYALLHSGLPPTQPCIALPHDGQRVVERDVQRRGAGGTGGPTATGATSTRRQQGPARLGSVAGRAPPPDVGRIRSPARG
jgi:hypothetical protein